MARNTRSSDGPCGGEALQTATRRSLTAVIAGGIACYRREIHLARLTAVTPDEIADVRPEARQAILARLRRALRAERNRGRAGHWSYDLNRHIALVQAYRAERRQLLGAGDSPLRKRRR